MKKYLLSLIFIFIDIVTLYMIFNFTLMVSDTNNFEFRDFIFICITILALFFYEKIYTAHYDFWQETYNILKALLLSYFIVFASMALLTTTLSYPASFITLYFLFAMLVLPGVKRLLKNFLYKIPPFRKKVYIAGNCTQSEVIRQEFIDNWYLGLEVCNDSYEMVVIPSESKDLGEINQEIDKYLQLCSEVYVVPYVTTMNFAHSNIMEYSNIRYNTIQIENRLLITKNIVIKNSFDFLSTFLVLPVFIPIHFIISILIKLDSSGKILFRQHRLGKDNKNFLCYKYRTMYENSDDILEKYLYEHPEEIEYYEMYHKYKNDPRITKIGKVLRATSLDELPQLFNVLRGEMSFVGPRPYMLNEAEKLGSDKELILQAKPGITGLWQVSGRNNLTFKERNNLEVWYIKNWSLWIDFIILIKTVKVVISKVGAK